MTDLNIKLFKWCDTNLEWKAAPHDLYLEAKAETLDLWNNGWLTAKETRAILLTLFRARYLMSHRIIINPPIALGSRRYHGE